MQPALHSFPTRRSSDLERLSFRHELVRDALYYDLPLTVRRGLHAEFASALAAAGRPPAQAADHVIRAAAPGDERADRKSTRLNSSHPSISYAVLCLKKK